MILESDWLENCRLYGIYDRRIFTNKIYHSSHLPLLLKCRYRKDRLASLSSQLVLQIFCVSQVRKRKKERKKERLSVAINYNGGVKSNLQRKRTESFSSLFCCPQRRRRRRRRRRRDLEISLEIADAMRWGESAPFPGKKKTEGEEK